VSYLDDFPIQGKQLATSMQRSIPFRAVIFCLVSSVQAQSGGSSSPSVLKADVSSSTIQLDGKLDERGWQEA
jgi:hypothetical protein